MRPLTIVPNGFFLQSQSEGCDQAQQNRRITKDTVNYKIHQFHGVNPLSILLLILEKLADLTFYFSQIHVAVTAKTGTETLCDNSAAAGDW